MPVSAQDMQAEAQATASKWKGLLVPALRKVQRECHSLLTIDDDAVEYLEELMIQLLYLICVIQPHSISEVKERVTKTFPPQLVDWTISFAQSTVEKGKKKKLCFPVDKIQPFLQKDVLGYKLDYQVLVYIVAVLEYISSDILKLTGNFVKNIRDKNISCKDLKVATKVDKALLDIFHGDEPEPSFEPSREPLMKRGSLSYEDILRDFTMSEEQYIRELNLLMKVFRRSFVVATHLFSEEDVNSLFCNLNDIYELTLQFWSMIEAATEMAGEETKGIALLGDYFEEMAEAAEFEVYETFAIELAESCSSKPDRHLCINEKVNKVLAKPGVTEYLKGKELYEATKYILPKLLFGPLYHCLEYFEYMKLMMTSSPDGEDREKIDEALGALRSLQVSLERIASSDAMRKRQEDRIFYQRRIGVNTHTTVSKMNEIQKNIDGWEGKDIRLCCSELLKEGQLMKPSQGGRKATERYVFLFDSLMICVKQNARHSITGLAGAEYRFKEKFFFRKLEIRDVDDTEELKHAFAIAVPDSTPYYLCCKSEEEKNDWMAVLMTLHLRSTLDRLLDAILVEEEQSIPLCLPEPADYCFAEEDTDETVVFEEGQENETGIPILKGGTLIKLVERLTYHKYADPAFIRIFLTTYRSFCKPAEFLDLLIKRYEIPEPSLSIKDQMAAERGQPVVREDLKRFRKEYAQPIQLRVLNVLRQWLDHHFYDFERDPELLVKLQQFFDSSVKNKAIKRSMDVISKIIRRKSEFVPAREQYSFSAPPPPFEWYLTQDPECFDILQLHPLEIGRQLTLIESEMFRLIKPSELVGSAWTKSDKDKTSPNALRMIRFSNTVTYWYEKCIVEAQNFEERVAVLSRIVDILMVLDELNNFNGILEVVSALNSAPVFRLHLAFAELTPKRQQALEESRELADSHHKKYVERLRSINPPCVPFLGMYLTNILKSEEGNPDFLPNYPEGIINFNKRRKVAEITGEIQQYQNQPYNLETEFSIRSFLETLDPLGGRNEKEMNDYLYENSLLIEPRNQKVPPKFPRKTDIPLKSPGIKPSTTRSGGGRKISSVSMTTSESDSSRSSSPQLSRVRSASQPLGSAESIMYIASNPLNSIEENELPPKPPPRESKPLARAPSLSEGLPQPLSSPVLPSTTQPDFVPEETEPRPPVPSKQNRPSSLGLIPPIPPRTSLSSCGDSPVTAFSPLVKRPPPPPPVAEEQGNPFDDFEDMTPPPRPPRPPKTPLTPFGGNAPVMDFDLPPIDSPPPVIPPRPPKTPK